MLSFIAKALSSGSRYIWGNILAPCEVINSMGIRMISVEALACFLSGYHLEDFFIDYAQSIGLAPTLCSYHKAFVGAVESGVCPKPKYAVTTSLSCDGNLNTFRFLEKQEQVPFSLLDVPYTNDEDAVIHFCHWGCKQVSGGSNILKNDMKEKEIPMLILDGDGIDKRNSHDGQIKTRLEAFLEMIEEDD